jgi:hypothetical protein
MKKHSLVILALATVALSSSILAEAAPDTPAVRRTAATTYGRLPLSFEANLGQTDERVKFVARGRGYGLFLTRDAAILALRDGSLAPAPEAASQTRESQQRSATLRFALVDGNPNPTIRGTDELPGKSNFLIGNDPKKWHTNVPTYAKVRYEDVYPGIDLVYYGNARELEYDFVVEPGADPNLIRFVLDPGSAKNAARAHDASAVRIDPDGSLVVPVATGELRFHKPVVYQPARAHECEKTSAASSAGCAQQRGRDGVDGRFVILADNRVGFELGAYDTTRPLIIDPVLEYSTFYGGAETDVIGGIAVNASGNAYVAGTTDSFEDFPTSDNLSPDNGGTTDVHQTDAFAAEINAEGTGYVWSTYLGGTSTDDGRAIAIDDSGNVYVTGFTASEDFPVKNEYDDDQTGSFSVFVTKIAPDGTSILYSTYLSATYNNNGGHAIAADKNGNAYVTGLLDITPGFPQRNGFVSDCDAEEATSGFITRLDTTKSGDESLVYSTVLCNFFSIGHGIAADDIGNVYVAGETDWPDFPTKNGFKTECDECDNTHTDAFFIKVDTDASGAESIVYSTFLGGIGFERAYALALDDDGYVYVTGMTFSPDFPVTEGALQTTRDTGFDAFVTKIDPAGVGEESLVWSTYLGGSDSDIGTGIAVDASHNVYVALDTESSDLPTRSAPQASFGGGVTTQFPPEDPSDAYVAKIRSDASDLLYATYVGGSHNETPFVGASWTKYFPPSIAVEGTNAYVGGGTRSGDFPVGEAGTNAYFDTLQGEMDGFIVKLALNPDFSLDALSSMTLDVSGSDTRTVTVNSLDSFSSAVTLSVPTPPTGFAISFDDNPVTPAADESVSTTMTVDLGLATVPGGYTLNVTGTAGTLTHSTALQVTVNASIGGTEDVIDGLTAIGCIDNSGVSNALLAKLTRAQAFIDAGNTQAAINTLNALLNQLNAQQGKHIATSCTQNSQTFDPSQVLITLVQTLLANLGVPLRVANPIIGYVLNTKGQPIVGATVSLVGSLKVAATTDVTGLYYYPNTGVLTAGAKYTANVSAFPKPYKSSAPSTQAFTWSKKAVFLSNFALK